MTLWCFDGNARVGIVVTQTGHNWSRKTSIFSADSIWRIKTKSTVFSELHLLAPWIANDQLRENFHMFTWLNFLNHDKNTIIRKSHLLVLWLENNDLGGHWYLQWIVMQDIFSASCYSVSRVFLFKRSKLIKQLPAWQKFELLIVSKRSAMILISKSMANSNRI